MQEKHKRMVCVISITEKILRTPKTDLEIGENRAKTL